MYIILKENVYIKKITTFSYNPIKYKYKNHFLNDSVDKNIAFDR